jgi:hypothetical protein
VQRIATSCRSSREHHTIGPKVLARIHVVSRDILGTGGESSLAAPRIVGARFERVCIGTCAYQKASSDGRRMRSASPMGSFKVM